MKLFTKAVKSKGGTVIWFFPYEFKYHGFVGFNKTYVKNWFAHTRYITHFFGFRFSHQFGEEIRERRIII